MSFCLFRLFSTTYESFPPPFYFISSFPSLGSSLFQCSVDDNIFKREDLLSLYSWGLDISVPILAKVLQAVLYCRQCFAVCEWDKMEWDGVWCGAM